MQQQWTKSTKYTNLNQYWAECTISTGTHSPSHTASTWNQFPHLPPSHITKAAILTSSRLSKSFCVFILIYLQGANFAVIGWFLGKFTICLLWHSTHGPSIHWEQERFCFIQSQADTQAPAGLFSIHTCSLQAATTNSLEYPRIRPAISKREKLYSRTWKLNTRKRNSQPMYS